MIATVNTFPALSSPNSSSSRGWILALIALLHIGFFYLLTSGLARPVMQLFSPAPLVVVPQDLEPAPQPPPKELKIDPKITSAVPVPPEPLPLPPDSIARITPNTPIVAPPVEPRAETAPPAPAIVQPAIPARGLSEPVYPAAEIRQGHTGTVLLSLYVLENGRVADVRIDQSSGYQRLDDSAVREARRWRLTPGTRDGLPAAMWKQVPVTFRLD